MLLRNIEQIKELEADVSYLTPEQQRIIAFWGSFGDETSLTEEKRKFLNIWRTLPDIYRRFRERIASLGMAYQGMAYRTAAEDRRGRSLRRSLATLCRGRLQRIVAEREAHIQAYSREQPRHGVSVGLRLVVYRPQGARSRYVHPRESVALSAHGRYISHDSLLRGDKRFESIACASNAIQCKYVADILRSLPPEQLDKRTAIVLDRRESALAAALLAARRVGGDQRHYGLPAAPDARIYLYRTSDPVAGALPAKKGCRGAILPCRRHGAAGAPYIAECCGSKASELSDRITSNRMISGQGIDVRGRYAAQCHIRPRRREAVAVGLSSLGHRAHRGAHSAERSSGRRVYGSGARGDDQA